MITKTRSAVPHHIHILFALPSYVRANHIYVSGDFNNWNQRALPMRQDRNGVWQAEIDLLGGRLYEFRYLVDGRWLTDSHADGFATNPYGTQNSIIETTLPIALLQYGPENEFAPYYVTAIAGRSVVA